MLPDKKKEGAVHETMIAYRIRKTIRKTIYWLSVWLVVGCRRRKLASWMKYKIEFGTATKPFSLNDVFTWFSHSFYVFCCQWRFCLCFFFNCCHKIHLHSCRLDFVSSVSINIILTFNTQNWYKIINSSCLIVWNGHETWWFLFSFLPKRISFKSTEFTATHYQRTSRCPATKFPFFILAYLFDLSLCLIQQ